MTSALRAGLETVALAANAAAKTKAWSYRVRKTDSLTIGGSVRYRVGARICARPSAHGPRVWEYPYQALTSQWGESLYG